MGYVGSFAPLPPDGTPPEHRPERCVLCGSEDPQWWYVVEPETDAHGRFARPTAWARWWAVGADCGRLLDRRATRDLQVRIAAGPHPLAADLVRDLVARIRPYDVL